MEKFTEKETEVFDYLDELRESGQTNMYGAGPYIEKEFQMEKAEAKEFLVKWMKTFSARHPSDSGRSTQPPVPNGFWGEGNHA